MIKNAGLVQNGRWLRTFIRCDWPACQTVAILDVDPAANAITGQDTLNAQLDMFFSRHWVRFDAGVVARDERHYCPTHAPKETS